MEEYKFCPMCASSLEDGHIEGRNRLFCPKCGWINYRNPVPVIACLVKNDDDSILLIKRGVDPAKGSWAFPGGFMEVGEDLFEAGKRELLEETGLKAVSESFLGVFTQESGRYGTVLVTGIIFGVDDYALLPGDDALDAGFFSPDTIPVLPFSSHRKLLELFLNSQDITCKE